MLHNFKNVYICKGIFSWWYVLGIYMVKSLKQAPSVGN